MKMLIRDKITGAYFNHGVWMREPTRAQEIHSLSEAWEIREQHHLLGAELYSVFEIQGSQKLEFLLELTMPPQRTIASAAA